MITHLVVTDGRADYLARSMTSYDRLHGPVTARVLHDDSGDPDFREHLLATYPEWTVVSTGQRSGFAGAYRSAWAWLRNNCGTPWVFSTEDDFVLLRDIDLVAMADVMDRHLHIAQMALLRQPWNPIERRMGGIVECDPSAYRDCGDHAEHQWLEHRKFFTTNPHLIRLPFIAAHDWPEGVQSEGHFGLGLFAREPKRCSAFWGARGSGPWVEHIGTERVGTGY